MTKEETRRAMLEAIEKADWEDEQPRLIYADWLDEQDEPEEAERQRSWVASARWLLGFLKEWKPYDPGDPPDNLNELVQDVKGGWFSAWGKDLYNEDELGDDAPLFWQHIEVVAGRKFDRPHRENMRWSCSC